MFSSVPTLAGPRLRSIGAARFHWKALEGQAAEYRGYELNAGISAAHPFQDGRACDVVPGLSATGTIQHPFSVLHVGCSGDSLNQPGRIARGDWLARKDHGSAVRFYPCRPE